MIVREFHIPVMFKTEIEVGVTAKLLGLLLHSDGRIHIQFLDEADQIQGTRKRKFHVISSSWNTNHNWSYVGSVFYLTAWHVFEELDDNSQDNSN